MNNLKLIEKVLYYVDEHLRENLTFEYLSEVFGYSAFHFHRIFSAVTAQTLTDYVKKRRLTLAHRQLCETNKAITDICYDCGFSSIPTFNRMFKENFGMCPSEVRNKKPSITYRSVDTIITGYAKRVDFKGEYVSQPQFVYREAFVLAGYRKHIQDGFEAIGESWHELKSNMDKIKRSDSISMYGFEDYMEDFSQDPLEFYYMAAIPVSEDTKLLQGMYKKRIPKALYAVFTVNGKNANGEIGKAFYYIYHTWLPNSEYCLDADVLADFEYYDERWDCQADCAQMDIYIPVRKLEDNALNRSLNKYNPT